MEKKAQNCKFLNLAFTPDKVAYNIYINSKEGDSVNTNPPALVIDKQEGWVEQHFVDIPESSGLPETKEAELIADLLNQLPYTPPADDLPVIKSFSASKSSVNLGESITLTWDVENAETLKLETPYEYDMTGMTSKSLVPGVTFEYVLTARNGDGKVTSSTVTVTVTDPNAEKTFQVPDYLMEDQMEYQDFHMWDYSTPTLGSTD